MGRLGTREGFGRYYDFSGGVIGGVSDFDLRPRHLRFSDNLLGRPLRCMGAVRGGYEEIQSSGFTDEPTSLFKYVPATGVSRLIVCTKSTTPGVGKVFVVIPGTPGNTQLSAPSGFTITDKDYGGAQLRNIMFLAQRDDSQLPVMFQRYVANGTYAFDNMKLKIPSLSATAAIQATTTGLVDLGYHWWRVRYLYRGGGSKATAAFPTGGRNVTAGNQDVLISGLLDTAITTPAAQDWYAWVIERTKLSAIQAKHYTGTLGTDALPDARAQWYFIAQGSTSTYTDKFADADLFDNVDEGIFGDPVHLQGLIAHKDRLFGWSGNTLYVSQAVADQFGTGPCNWDPDNAYIIGPEGVDTIQTVVQQVDRLAVILGRNVYPFEGDDPDTFRTYPIPNVGGAAGHRCAASFGAAVVIFDGTNLTILRGNRLEPWGTAEVTHYLDGTNPAAAASAVVYNYIGELMLLGYPTSGSTFNNEVVVYDFLAHQFRHFTHMRVRHAALQGQGSTDFGGAPMLFIDVVQTPTGEENLIFGGAVLPAPATPSFHVWKAFTGTQDEVIAGGGGGTPIPIRSVTQMLDDGRPDDWKDLARVQLDVDGFSSTLGLLVTCDRGPEGGILSVGRIFQVTSNAKEWTDDAVGVAPNDLVWASDDGTVGGEWAEDQPSSVFHSGLPLGTAGRRYSVEVYGNVSEAGRLNGLTIDGKLLPERRLS